MLKEIFDNIPLFLMNKKNPVLDQNVSKIIKMSKSLKQLKKTTGIKDIESFNF